MQIGEVKLDNVYFFVCEKNKYSFTCKNAHEVRRIIHDLRCSNRKNLGVLYGDINVDKNIITYKEYKKVEVPSDVDEMYIDTNNMTELRNRFEHSLKGKKNVKLATLSNGLIKPITKRTNTKKLLLVEELDTSKVEGLVEECPHSEEGFRDKLLREYDLLPDARYIYRRDSIATDYDTHKTIHSYKVYRVLERTNTLEEMDEKLRGIQNEYILREKYHISDNSKVTLLRLPNFKEYSVLYKEDKGYTDPDTMIKAISSSYDDTKFIESIISDEYTNLKRTVFDEETMDPEYETKRNKIIKYKRHVKGELTRYKVLKEKDSLTFDEEKELTLQRGFLKDAIYALIYTLVYKDSKKKQVNYSLLRHLGSMLRDRNNELENMKDEYFDALLKDIDRQEKEGTLPECNFHIIRF